MPVFSSKDAVAFARSAGICRKGPARVSRLPGGVSSDALLVRCGPDAIVVKHAFRRFRVRARWLVDPGRLAVEFAFAHLLSDRLGPDTVAAPLAYSPARDLLAVRYVGRPFVAWKERLLRGRVDASVARAAGRLLARVHRLGLEEPYLKAPFHNPRLFEEQRIDPYLITTARHHPAVSTRLGLLAAHLRRTRLTLIHGDFSPKNLLTDGRSVRLIDHEVATWGDPRFDVAFLLNHLLLKAIRRPAAAHAYASAARAFLTAYGAARGPAPFDSVTSRLLGALMLARVDGKSPVDYLSASQRREARALALAALERPPRGLSGWLAALVSSRPRRSSPPSGSGSRGRRAPRARPPRGRRP